MNKCNIDYKLSHLNADSGFDIKDFITFTEKHKFIPNIKQNKRNTKKNKQKNKQKNQEYRYMSDYIYSNRFKVEVVFAWLDTYKRLLIRFELLARNFKAWLLLAATLINFRHVFN
jgi:transposase